MKKAEEIKYFVKSYFELYGLDYLEYFGMLSDENALVEIPFEMDNKLNMDMVTLAGQALGLSIDDVLAMNEKAADKWYKKYTFFSHIGPLNMQYRRSFFSKEAEPLWLMEAIFNVNLDDQKPTRYDYQNVKERLVQQLQKVDESLPGTFHPNASIQNLKVVTNNFCSYNGIEDMVRSYIQMVERAKGLFQKALDCELAEEEINEYNILVSALGIRDKACVARGYLYYQNLRNCAEIYREEGLLDFFEIVNFHHCKIFNPWRCKEFSCSKELVQAFVNIIPETKKEMREYAIKVLQFCCYFVWSDAKPIQLDPWEEDELDDIDRHMGTENTQRAKEPTIVYVPKTDDELNGDREVAETLIKLCGAEACGGVTLPAHRNSALLDVNKISNRLDKLVPHGYEKWFNYTVNRKTRKPSSTAESGGSTDE